MSLAVGIAGLCAAGLLVGLLARRADNMEEEPEYVPVQHIPQIVVTDPSTTARKLSDAALAQIGISRPQAEAMVTRYGPDTYVVFGTCLLGDERQIYETTCRAGTNGWDVVKLTLNGQEIAVELRVTDVKENR